MDGRGFLSEETQREVQDIGRADILVGIPSYNNARTIGHVVRAVATGLANYFPDAKSVLVNSDGGSLDGTQEVVLKAGLEDLSSILVSHPVHPLQKIVTPYHGIPGKGSAFRTIFKIAEELEVKACAVVDSDLRSITPEWIELLIGPIYYQGYDYVSPLYTRHKYDGTITNSIVYPLTRALYGKQIRQPIGGDFGFSGKLASLYLNKDVWESDVARYGIDIWMTTTAVAGGFQVCQSYLGAKIHDPKDPTADLSSMLSQVVSSVFGLMEEHYGLWSQVRGSSPVPLFGFPYEVGVEPVHVNVERMINAFHHGLKDLLPLWEQVLSQETLQGLFLLGNLPKEDFRFPMELWVRVIYDFALAYHYRILHRDHLMRCMTPLYLGRTASFVLETQDSSAEEVEEILEVLCQGYEAWKPYLLERWR